MILERLRRYSKIYLQVKMTVTMGMRISEILHLHKDEVDLVDREINLDPHRLKIRKQRQVPIPIAVDIFPLLKEAYEKAPGPYIFSAIYTNKPGRPIDPNKPQDDNRYYWDKVREETGIDLRFHDLRHTCITNAFADGMA